MVTTVQVGPGDMVTRPAVGPVAGVVTLVFTDIEGSTRLAARLGDGYWELLSAHRRLVRTAFERARGREIDTQGDSFFFAFDRARDAVSAAVAAQRALRAHDWSAGVPVRVRMGIHTTEPTLWSGGYVGLGVHRGARICAAGHGGQILLSDATRALIRNGSLDPFRLRNLGWYHLKDLDRPDRIWQVAEAGLADRFPPLRDAQRVPSRTAEPEEPDSRAGADAGPGWLRRAAVPTFVGRTAELRTLEDAWSRAISGRRGLMLLGGDAGIGKTTLAARLAVIVHASGGLVLTGRAAADARVPYQVFLECFDDYSRAAPKAVLDAGLDRLAGRISHLLRAASERTATEDGDLPVTVRLGGDRPERPVGAPADPPGGDRDERSRVFEVVDDLLGAMAARRPVLIVLDDLHEADDSSLHLLRQVLRAPRPTPLLVLATYRDPGPGRAGTSFRAALTDGIEARHLTVGGLGAVDSAELIARVSGVKLAEPVPRWTRQLHEATGGNPVRLIDTVRRQHDADTLPAGRAPRAGSGPPTGRSSRA